eukprot:EG_transcript_30011
MWSWPTTDCNIPAQAASVLGPPMVPASRVPKHRPQARLRAPLQRLQGCLVVRAQGQQGLAGLGGLRGAELGAEAGGQARLHGVEEAVVPAVELGEGPQQ